MTLFRASRRRNRRTRRTIGTEMMASRCLPLGARLDDAPRQHIGSPYIVGADYRRCYDGGRGTWTMAARLREHSVPERRTIVAPSFTPPRKKRSARRSTAHKRAGRGTIGARRISTNEKFALRDVPVLHHAGMLTLRNITQRYAVLMGGVLTMMICVAFVGTAFAVKARVAEAGTAATASLKTAMARLSQKDFAASQEELDEAYEAFTVASEHVGRLGRVTTFVAQFVPGATQLAAGDHMVRAAVALTHAAKELHGTIPQLLENGENLTIAENSGVSFLELYRAIADRVDVAYADVHTAQSHVRRVRIEDVPEDYREMFLRLTDALPHVEESLARLSASRPVIEDVLGANGPRTYLLLFQNNHEMRATGGFIGSYGIVKITNGHIEKIMVDDIYNPDGQLTDRIVPPLPIQKISANWSMHDSNWFAHYPTSARKAMEFYERTGGPTVDGVIAITPTVIQHILRVTGPIDVPDYGVQLTSDNVVDVLQEEIEDRDNYATTRRADDANMASDTASAAKKTQPKKILSSVMPIMLERIMTFDDPERLANLVDIVTTGLQQRHILLYVSDQDGEEMIMKNGWGGAVESTDHDYLSVINTNINGFKTDGMIDESITHTATIDTDGGIVNTVRITRTHAGGHTDRPWWDAVNANYVRVYVPEGSQLLSVEGQTREVMTPRLNYDELGYTRDPDVVREEGDVRVDEETGTRIYTDAGKTVFANWVYVSPQESVTVTYTYKLPFTVTFDRDATGAFGSYGILVQKQAGSTNTTLSSSIVLPASYTPVWQSSDGSDMRIDGPLEHDRFHGAVFRLPQR